MNRSDPRRLVRDLDVDRADHAEQEREWDGEVPTPEHRPIPIDAPEADALDQEREVPLEDDDRR